MKTPTFPKRPRNKSNMDAPQEEFIAPSGTHVEPEKPERPETQRTPVAPPPNTVRRS